MDKIKKTQEAIEEVKNQLHQNIEAIHERGERLDNLQQKSGQSKSRIASITWIRWVYPSHT